MPTKSDEKRELSKKSATVFDYIQMLRHERRIVLLKALLEERKPIAFMDLLRKCKLPKESSPDASYHLTELKEKGIVIQQDTKYFLSSFGENLLEKFFELEDVFSEHASGILIRTSRYSMEPFSEEKIASSLINEAKMPAENAVEVARETRIRLQRAKVQYLTTPLIREYINAILIEKHMEEYRHKLTRLGVPGYDIEEFLQKNGSLGLPGLQTSISRETLEQFVLLRTLPKHLADAVLQRVIGLSSLALFPFLPEELVIHWEECIEKEPVSFQDILLSILNIISTHLHKFGKNLTILGVPPPSSITTSDLHKIGVLTNAIEHIMKTEDKRIRIIFAAEMLPEILNDQELMKYYSKNIEFFCHQGDFSFKDLTIPKSPTFYGNFEDITPCFESFYCNLLLLNGEGDNVIDLTPSIDHLSDIVAGIISVKEESMLANGHFPLDEKNYIINLRPVGLAEFVRFHRGFEIDQTEDSEQYALEILQIFLNQISKKLGGKYNVQLGQPWISPHLVPFIETAVNECKDLKDIQYFGSSMVACSPGFIRPNGKLTVAKCAASATRLLGQIPGVFHINLSENPSIKETQVENTFKIAVGKERSILLDRQNCMKIGEFEIPIGNFF
ncbi:MAG: regulatory protein ArsR [Promethearchaeota archaeon CR_4]|nr:MAG: regulatory protein ArsR [Candidatus Lokiarchaeota archaeon CR_4]